MRKYLILGGAVLIIAVGSFFALKPSFDSPPSANISDTPTLVHSSISLSFGFGTEKKSFEISTTGQTSLFELIQKTDLQIETENFPPIGKMIVSINGFKNGTDGKYWQYWINGQYAQIGASSYKPKPNDSIEWKFSNDSAQ